jgi:FMN phosphatase YigB (HAD superfamily)
MNIKAIIFDWARTLYDVDKNKEFFDSIDVLEYCKNKKYRLALVSLVSEEESVRGTNLKIRNEQINNSPLKTYFEKILTTDGDKDIILGETIKYFGIPNEEVLIVDDRVIRGIKYGNQNGCQTAWLQKGAFAKELPSPETGNPTFVIKSLSGLKEFI